MRHPSKTQMTLRLRTIGLMNEILQKLKLIVSKNVVKPSNYTALLSIFPPQSEKNCWCEICISEILRPQ